MVSFAKKQVCFGKKALLLQLFSAFRGLPSWQTTRKKREY